MITCCRKIQFCSGHRVLGHESKCANLHGHNYIIWIHAAAKELDSLGRIIDFSVLKERIGKWIDDNWDHTMIIYEKDYNLIPVLQLFETTKKVWIAPFNPTAENMADHILRVVAPLVLADTNIVVEHIELFETENCKADARL